jgi:hypothetical protein
LPFSPRGGRDESEREPAPAEESLQSAAASLDPMKQRLIELERHRTTALGEAETPRRAPADVDEEIGQAPETIAGLELEKARAALAEAVQRRDQVIRVAAAALDSAVDHLAQIEAQRAAVVEAEKRLTALQPPDAWESAVAPEEPDILTEPWQRMVAAVKTQLDEELDEDIIEAAARSYTTYAINVLPPHLQELAMQRRRELQRADLERLYGTRRD